MRFNRAARGSDVVDIWHETYLVRAGEYETVYDDVPAYGLGEVGDLVPAAGSRRSAAGRLGRTDGTDVAADESGVTPVDDTGDGEPSRS
jgi:hypothetical protein